MQSLCFLSENVQLRVQICDLTMATMCHSSLKTRIFNHLPCRPDLAPCDRLLFPQMKVKRKGPFLTYYRVRFIQMCNCKWSEVEVVQHCPRKGMVGKSLQYVKSLKYQHICFYSGKRWISCVEYNADQALNQSSTFANEDAL